MEAGRPAIEARLRLEARTIREKYVAPPHTTDFGVMFVPTEGLYAEALRRPGLVESLQREHKVMLTGPTTLLATLNSLQMGFRTLALEQRSAEVWETLGAVKTEFAKFGEVLARTKKKLDEASSSIDLAERRSRVMARELRNVAGASRQPRPRPSCRQAAGRRHGRCLVARRVLRPGAAGADRRQVALHSCMARGAAGGGRWRRCREGRSAWAVGLLLGLFAAAPIVLALAARRLADRHGYHRPIRIAVGLTIVGGASHGLDLVRRGCVRPCSAGGHLSGAGANIGLIAIRAPPDGWRTTAPS